MSVPRSAWVVGVLLGVAFGRSLITGELLTAAIVIAAAGALGLMLTQLQAAADERHRRAVHAVELAVARFDSAVQLRRDVLDTWARDCRHTGRPMPLQLATMLEHDLDEPEIESAKARLRDAIDTRRAAPMRAASRRWRMLPFASHDGSRRNAVRRDADIAREG